MMQTKCVSRKQIYIIGVRNKPMFNIANPELQGGTNCSHIGQINNNIRPNVNNDKEETIHIMTDSNLQHVFNLCTIIDLNLLAWWKAANYGNKKWIVSVTGRRKMSQHSSDFSLILQDCINDLCTQTDCMFCTKLESEADLSREIYFLDLKNQANKIVVEFEDQDLGDKHVLFTIQQSQEFCEKKKIYKFLKLIHPFNVNADAPMQTLYLGSNVNGCASKVGLKGIHGVYHNVKADQLLVQMFVVKKQNISLGEHPDLRWRNDDHPEQFSCVDVSIIVTENEPDDVMIESIDW